MAAVALIDACGGAPAPSPHAVHYAIAWARDDVVPAPDGVGWEVTNDLGYRVRVTRGYLTSYSIELVECPKVGMGGVPTDVVGTLWSLLGPPPVWAGHGSGTPNPAAIRPMQVESLGVPADREVGTVTLVPQAYCQVHYLIARASNDSPGLPGDLDMVDTSLHIDGTYRAPGSERATPFTVHTAVANGALFGHTASSTPVHVDTGVAGTRVTVRRHLGSIFGAVDFAKMPEAVRAGRILESVIEHAEVDIVRVQ